MPPSWCFLGNFYKFSKLISSQNLTKQRSSKNAILTYFWPTITSKYKIILRWVCFWKIFISDEINLQGDHKNSLLGWRNFGPRTKLEDLTVLLLQYFNMLWFICAVLRGCAHGHIEHKGYRMKTFYVKYTIGLKYKFVVKWWRDTYITCIILNMNRILSKINEKLASL